MSSLPLKRTKNFVVIFVILNLAVFGINFYLRGKISDAKIEISKVMEDLNIQVERQKRLKSSETLAENTKSDRAVLEEAFVREEGIVRFIEEIETLASIAGVSLQIGNVQVEQYLKRTEVKSNVLEYLALDMKTTGSWQDTNYFVSLVESMPISLTVIDGNLDFSGGSEDGQGTWQGLLKAKVLKRIERSDEDI